MCDAGAGGSLTASSIHTIGLRLSSGSILTRAEAFLHEHGGGPKILQRQLLGTWVDAVEDGDCQI